MHTHTHPCIDCKLVCSPSLLVHFYVVELLLVWMHTLCMCTYAAGASYSTSLCLWAVVMEVCTDVVAGRLSYGKFQLLNYDL